MKKIIFTTIMMTGFVVMAAGGSHGHDADYVPLDKIGWQAVNLGILLTAIIFFIKGSIVEAFSKRRQSFVEQSQKTQVALKAAEEALADIKTRLKNLEENEKSSLENARKESQNQSDVLTRDAYLMVEKMKKDTALLVENELAKAKAEINTMIMDQAMSAAKAKISDSKNIDALEKQFVNQLGQVKA